VRLLSSIILETKSLEAGYKGIKVLWGISISVRHGEILSILGPNGAGKSTLLRTIMSLIKPLSGKVEFEGQDITYVPPHEKVKLGLYLVPDNRGLFPDMSVYENLLMGANLVKDRKIVKKKMEQVFTIFPVLKERSKQKAKTLSGGEQQMLAIAKILMGNPKLLMFDEPTMGLSPKLSMEVINSIKRLREELGITIMLVEEKIKYALEISDRTYVIDQGKIVYEVEKNEYSSKENILGKYVGR
jgi:branched-chain amino acid transport system ATP-binding protein